jgi:hypothetical protein
VHQLDFDCRIDTIVDSSIDLFRPFPIFFQDAPGPLSVRPDEIATLDSFLLRTPFVTQKKWRVHWLQPKRENSCFHLKKLFNDLCVLDPGDVRNLTNQEGCRLWFNKDKEMLQFSVITVWGEFTFDILYTYANARGMCNFGSRDVWTVLDYVGHNEVRTRLEGAVSCATHSRSFR